MWGPWGTVKQIFKEFRNLRKAKAEIKRAKIEYQEDAKFEKKVLEERKKQAFEVKKQEEEKLASMTSKWKAWMSKANYMMEDMEKQKQRLDESTKAYLDDIKSGSIDSATIQEMRNEDPFSPNQKNSPFPRAHRQMDQIAQRTRQLNEEALQLMRELRAETFSPGDQTGLELENLMNRIRKEAKGDPKKLQELTNEIHKKAPNDIGRKGLMKFQQKLVEQMTKSPMGAIRLMNSFYESLPKENDSPKDFREFAKQFQNDPQIALKYFDKIPEHEWENIIKRAEFVGLISKK